MRGFREEIILLSVSKYGMVDEKSGEWKEGTTFRYVLSNSLLPVNDPEEENLKGVMVAKTSYTSMKVFDEFNLPVPGVYEADLKFTVSSKGVAKVEAKNFEYKRPVVITDIIPAELQNLVPEGEKKAQTPVEAAAPAKGGK